MRFATVAAFAFAPLAVLADGPSIIAALNKIDAAAIKLNGSLNGFTNLINAIPILADSIALQNALDDGTKVANASAPLSVDEAVSLVTPTQKLVADTKSIVNNFIAKKPVFDKNGLTFIVPSQLQGSKGKATAFANAVIAKVPDSLKSTAQGLTSDLEPTFQKAIDAYNQPAAGGFKLPFKA